MLGKCWPRTLNRGIAHNKSASTWREWKQVMLAEDFVLLVTIQRKCEKKTIHYPQRGFIVRRKK